MNKKYKLKKKYKIMFSIIILLIIGIIAFFYISYRLSNEYKFKELGYSENDVEYLLTFDEAFQNKLLELGHDEEVLEIVKEKYFIEDNLDRYLAYKKKRRVDEIEISEIVALVNINRDRDYYEQPVKTDTSKGNLMLVNKYHYLDESYVPEGVEKASNWYAYDGILAAGESYRAFIKMFNAAKEEGMNLILNSGYRSYADQKAVYEDFDKNYGEEYADNYAARAGYSEHQTGLAYDIVSPGTMGEDFDKTEEFEWLQDNAHKYGFILRYPKDREEYTGFQYESWHYRYVGEDTARIIKKEGITFDEYYAYYIENKK